MHAPILTIASGSRRLVALLAALALPPLGAWAQDQPAPEPAAPDQAAPGGAARAPQDPLELWYQIDYLVRVGKPEQAAPYLDRFLKGGPDDPTLLAIRDRYGVGSILRLEDYPQTQAQARALLDLLSAASRRHARQAGRIRRFVDLLTASAEEQDYALDRLREAGPYAVPPLIDALNAPGRPREERALLRRNLGRLDRAAIPALLAALDSPDRVLAGDVAEALGQIGDRRAVPFLTFYAARGEAAARRALGRLTGRPVTEQPRTPVRVLADEAWRYHRHEVDFPGDAVEVWTWVEGAGPSPRTVARSEAEGILGLRFARQALELDPADRSAQAALLSLALEKAVERVGLTSFPAQDPAGVYPLALAAGPEVLGEVVRRALADGHSDLAAAAVWILSQVADRDARTTDRPPPLVEALSAPDRRVQFAAAQALVELAPRRPFPGASRVVPVLARFVSNPSTPPRAVIIDGAINRANQVAGVLQGLGYEPEVAIRGDQGFRLASESADVEAIFLEPTLLQGDWTFVDTLANLRADARTAGLPIILLGDLSRRERLEQIAAQYPRVAFQVTPVDAALFRRQLDRELGRMGVRPLAEAERQAYARAAAALLARIAAQPGSPFGSDLPGAQRPLSAALHTPALGPAATVALGEVPGREAQRGLADLVLDASQATPARLAAAGPLIRSLQRFGPLVTSDQERRLAEAFAAEADPAPRAALAAIIGALRPRPEPVGLRLRAFAPPAIGPAAAAPAPGSPPSAATEAPPGADPAAAGSPED